jgi:hypothetical protein
MKTMKASAMKRSNRAKQRGAAMVEGIVVMTTMLVFLGMNIWAGQVYGGKLDQANSTRRDVLYYASHGCEQTNPTDADTYTQSTLSGISGAAINAENLNVPPPDQARDRVGGNFEGTTAGQGINGAVSRSWNTASGGKGPQEVSGSTLVGDNSILVQKRALSVNLGTNSYAACNEKTYNNQWTAFFEFSWDFLKRGAGADVF